MGGYYVKRLASSEFDAFLQSNEFLRTAEYDQEHVRNIFDFVKEEEKSLFNELLFVELKITCVVLGIESVLKVRGKKHFRWSGAKVSAISMGFWRTEGRRS